MPRALDDEYAELRRAWLAAAQDPSIALELEAIYEMVSDQITARGPACWASGRCCNFEKFGHRLYVTGLEAAYTVARLPAPLLPNNVQAARVRGDCPLLVANLCGVHTIKPLGCRVYFCDRSAQDWQMDLSERAIAQVKGLHEAHSVPYRYGEWRGMLELLAPTAP